MAPEATRLVRGVSFLLLALAAAETEIAAVDTRPTIESLGLAAVWVLVAAIPAVLLPHPRDPSRLPRLAVGVFFLLGAAPFMLEPLRREWTDDGYPFELQMVFGLRNVGLGLAACSGWAPCLRLSVIVSLFLTLFSAAMSNHPAVRVMLWLYTLAGGAWLVLANGSRLPASVASVEAIASLSGPGRGWLRWRALVTAGLVAVCVFGLFIVGPNRAAFVLGEWLPTSGGTGAYDRFARSGVNDGDEETSGANANSTGMTGQDSFLESPLPSLYDVAMEMYGPPHKPTKEIEEAIALSPTDNVRTNHNKTPDSLRPNRSFPTSRKSPRQPGTPLSRSSRAIFEVEGRTPLHVRVLAYDQFDGRAWHEAPLHSCHVLIEKDQGSEWMMVSDHTLPIHGGMESHSLKLTSPEGSFIPTPPHLARFRVGRVNRTSFFDWGHDRVLKFANRKTPSGIVVETESRPADPRRLSAFTFPAVIADDRSDYMVLPDPLNLAVRVLAQKWVEGLPAGWPRMAAIVDHLRNEYTLDPSYSPPAECADPLAHFLLEARRGPDYQFASAAAVLLRIAGYPTRLACGFYAHPAHYDAETGHTPVVKEDMHFWPEAKLPNGDWLVLEPTPGYEVLLPRRSLLERIGSAAEGVLDWSWRNVSILVPGVVALAFAFVFRRDLFDALTVQLWRWWPGKTWREGVRRGVRLLERRGRWAGHPRKDERTVTAWLADSLPEPVMDDADLRRLMSVAEWAAYAPEMEPPWPEADAVAVCRRVLDTWTLRRWRRLEMGGGASAPRDSVFVAEVATLPS